MEFAELKKLTDEVTGFEKNDFQQLFVYTTIGGSVWPQYEGFMMGSNSLEQFYETLYQQDEFKGEQFWALWARMRHKYDWPERFEPIGGVNRMEVQKRHMIIESESLQVLVPVDTHYKEHHLRLFNDRAFNEDAADLFTTVSGTFKINNIEVPEGAYDIYTSGPYVILEKWAFDVKGRRANINGRDIKELELAGGGVPKNPFEMLQ